MGSLSIDECLATPQTTLIVARTRKKESVGENGLHGKGGECVGLSGARRYAAHGKRTATAGPGRCGVAEFRHNLL